MKKPRPPPAKKNATVVNETAESNTTTSADEPITVKVDLPTDEGNDGKESKAEGTDKEDL